jgi:hypothetical protein
MEKEVDLQVIQIMPFTAPEVMFIHVTLVSLHNYWLQVRVPTPLAASCDIRGCAYTGDHL